MFDFKDLFEEYIKHKAPSVHDLYVVGDGILFCGGEDCEECPVQTQCYSHPLKRQGKRPVITDKEAFKLQYLEYFL